MRREDYRPCEVFGHKIETVKKVDDKGITTIISCKRKCGYEPVTKFKKHKKE